MISHLGLSLHFLRHHLVDGPAAETLALAHARAYMRILTSLRPGGSFAYAPALSSVEELLPASDYRCERVGRARYIRLAHGPRAHGARPSPSLARLTGRVVLPTNRGE